MAAGLQKTLNLLRRTPNRAATPMLVAGLQSHFPAVREGAIQSVARRCDMEAHIALLDCWRDLSEAEIALLSDKPHRMHDALEQALLGDDPLRCDHACHAILVLREYDVFPGLITAIEKTNSRHAARVSATLVRLAKLLHDEVENATSTRPRRDPYFIRRQVIAELSKSLDRFHEHGILEVVEVFLLLVPHDHAALHQLLANPWHPCYERLIESLKSSPAPGVLRLLTKLLQDTSTSDALLQIIATRADQKFLEYLLHDVGLPVNPRVLLNLGRLDHIAWLQEDRDVLLRLDGKAQQVAVTMAVASSLRRHKVLDLLADLMRKGQPAGRKASCSALAEFPGRSADVLIKQALQDPDVGVQAAAAEQIRQRELPGSMTRLISLLDSPHEELRAAAQMSLSDFNLVTLCAEWDEMSDESRHEIGEIVGKSDPTAAQWLAREISGPSPTQRLRALEMVQVMGLANQVAPQLISLLRDKRAPIPSRVEAAQALAACQGPETHAALEEAAEDSNVSVREAAQASLEKLPMQQTTSWGGPAAEVGGTRR